MAKSLRCALPVLAALVLIGTSMTALARERTPAYINHCADLRTTGGGDQLIYEVPVDRRLIIEFISTVVDGAMEEGEYVSPTIRTTVNGVEAAFQAGEVSGDVFALDKDSRMVKIYADPGTSVVGGISSRNNFDDVTLCISGRLVLPAEFLEP